mmetsp:Transcript_6553/g.11667  ORF Transcript_6553/g.11667 Transcript_6553/m.11667 type:complete len:83 (+) Transcript_6553:35-283(+)
MRIYPPPLHAQLPQSKLLQISVSTHYDVLPAIHPCFAISSLNCQSGGTAMDQLNLSRKVFEKTFSIGTSFRLQKATDIRGSM